MGYEELENQVKVHLREALAARFRGDLHVNKVRPQAYADGYMRALADAGLFSQEELLDLVAESRSEVVAQPQAETPRIAAVG